MFRGGWWTVVADVERDLVERMGDGLLLNVGMVRRGHAARVWESLCRGQFGAIRWGEY